MRRVKEPLFSSVLGIGLDNVKYLKVNIQVVYYLEQTIILIELLEKLSVDK